MIFLLSACRFASGGRAAGVSRHRIPSLGGVRRGIFALCVALVLPGRALAADGSELHDRIWLESYLSYPIADVAFTASAMGYVGRVKEAESVFAIHGGRAGGIQRKTVARFFEDGRAVDEVDTDPATARTLFAASFRYDDRKRITNIIRDDMETKQSEAIDFSYDSRGVLAGAVFRNNGLVTKRIEVASAADGRPQEVVTRLPGGQVSSRITYTYGKGTVDIAYEGDFGAARVHSLFTLDAQGRPVAAETQRRDEVPEVDYDGSYSYTYRPDGTKVFHGVELHAYAQPHPTKCVLDEEFFANGGAKSAKAVGDDVTCERPYGTTPVVELDAQGNFRHTRLGAYEHTYQIEYFGVPAM